MDKNPHVIKPPKVSDSIFVKIKDTIINKQNQLLQIPVIDLHNGIILKINQGGLLVQ